MSGSSMSEQDPVSGRACLRCAQHKRKCDNAVPVCGLCGRLGEECAYPSTKRKRGPAPGQYKHSIERIKELEATVAFLLQLPGVQASLENLRTQHGNDYEIPLLEARPGSTSNPSTTHQLRSLGDVISFAKTLPSRDNEPAIIDSGLLGNVRRSSGYEEFASDALGEPYSSRPVLPQLTPYDFPQAKAPDRQPIPFGGLPSPFSTVEPPYTPDPFFNNPPPLPTEHLAPPASTKYLSQAQADGLFW